MLAGYTLVLATIGVWIVRWGKVWEDARSILLLLLILFLAVSISADGLFVKAEAASAATSLLLCGFLFSAVVSEGVLWGAGVRSRAAVPHPLPPTAGPVLHRAVVVLAWTSSAIRRFAGLAAGVVSGRRRGLVSDALTGRPRASQVRRWERHTVAVALVPRDGFRRDRGGGRTPFLCAPR